LKLPATPGEVFLHSYFSQSFEIGASGSDLLSEENALWKALAETAERYLWKNSADFFKNRILRKSYKEMRGRAINIYSLAGFSDTQKKELEIIKFDNNTVFGWLPARSLLSGRRIFCPLQLISGLYYRKNVKTSEYINKKEPMLRWGITTGLATGASLEEAVVKGILEIIERDSFMIAYSNRLSPPSLDLDHLSAQDEDLKRIFRLFKRYQLEAHLINLPTDFSVNVVLALVIDKTNLGPALSVGASADFDLKTAVVDALSESQMIRYSQIGIRMRKEGFPETKNTNRAEKMLFWSDPKNLPKIDFLLNGAKQKIDIHQKGEVPQSLKEGKPRKEYWTEKMKILSAQLKERGYEACYVEITSKEVRNLGLRCAFTVIPKLQPMSLNDSIPYLGGTRLKEVPLKLGYEAAEQINLDPHPFP
jgi:ribosomal protein S12 methylthiotransferase accessory factor